MFRFYHASTGAAIPPNSMREFILEEIRERELPHAVSRLQCFFGTNYLEEAIRYANTIEPVPKQPIPIFEVYTARFVTLDMSHTNLPPDHPDFVQYARWYWKRVISNNGPPSGNRTPPQLEVLLQYPIRVGPQIATANVHSSPSPASV